MYKLDGRRTFTFELWMFNPLECVHFFYQDKYKKYYISQNDSRISLQTPPPPAAFSELIKLNNIQSWKIIL